MSFVIILPFSCYLPCLHGHLEPVLRMTPVQCCVKAMVLLFLRYWTLNDAHPDKWMPFQYPLPSDCSKRLDLQTLLSGDIAAAQEMKVELENLQRSDAKIRKAAGSLG